MKFPTQFTSKVSTFILAMFIAVGCAGINDANFSQDTEKAPVLEDRDYNNDKGDVIDPASQTEQREDIRVLRPDHD